MDETLMKLRILAKAETTLLKANARRAAMRARLFAVAIGLVGLDERAADVVAADEADVERDAALLRVADAGGVAAVGDGEDDVGVDRVLAAGPVPMMRAVAELTRSHAVPTVASLNPIMVDGTGMCGGCRVTVGGEVRFACVDGPDFDGHDVDFDDLVNRLNRFQKEERQAVVKWSESCKANLES